jgi:F-type H+-transporting ATPase subunit b
MEFNATFLATIISFIIFVILMNKILYAPILNIMAERKLFIDSNYKSAQKNDEKSNALLQEKEEKLIEAKDDARNKYNEILDEFKSQRTEIVVDAQDASKDELENFKVELENISNDTKQKLKSSMTDLASDIVEKVIGYRSDVQDFDDNVVNGVLWESK